MRRLVACAALAGCGDGGMVVTPVIDLPAAGSEADPLPSLEEVELSVARAGSPTPLVSATFSRGEDLSLAGVPVDDDLVVHLIGRAADVEVAYGRTCSFDLAAGVDPPELHLWFTRTVHWAPAVAPAITRVGGDAWQTADQGLAVALGASVDGPATAVEHFDPRTGTWSVVASVSVRSLGVVAARGDGRGVLLGGRDGAGLPHTLIEVVDPFVPEAGRVEVIEDARLGLDFTAAETLETGDVVVVGGRTATGPVATLWLLTLVDNVPAPPRELDAQLAIPRSGHTLTRLSDVVGAPVVVIGGLDAADLPVAEAELFRPLRDDFSPDFTATMVVPRHGHSAVRLPDGSVLVIGGRDALGDPVTTMELFTLDGGFTAVGELPAAAGLDGAALTALPDGRVLLSGGSGAGDVPTAASYVIRLDPLDGSVDIGRTDDLDTARSGHAAGLLCDGTVLAVGGTGSATAERYEPPSAGRR